jgi:alpha-galactosidase
MDRRHFIKVTGGTIGSLAFAGSVFAGNSKTIQLPSKVSVKTPGGVMVLQSKNKITWTAKDVVVSLKEHSSHLAIHVHSPKSQLFEVVLEWPLSFPKTSMVLPDHWERTYGDISWKKPIANERIPWYFLVHDGNDTKGFGVKTGTNTICSWKIEPGTISLHLDTRNGSSGVKLGERTLHAADVVTIASKPGESAFETGKRFCSIMCEKPRLPKQPVYGINDWYFAYGKNSYDLILQHTSMLAPLATDPLNRPFSVIDAGWATYSPLFPDDCCWQEDYSKPNDHFKDMAKLAAEIKILGMRPALWTRPLCGKHDDPVQLMLPSIPGRNDPKKPVLDPSIDENIQRITNNFTIYRDWGYEMVKHDFTTYDILGKWGFEMKDDITYPGWHFKDETKTTAEIILNLYQNIRDAAGEMYLIGCNTLSHLSAGLFELNRIGDDTSGNEWERTRKMGVNTLAFRSIQHNHFYAADADCVGLTKNIEWSRNKQWMELLAKSGTPLFISAQPDAMGEEQKAFIKECFSIAAKPMPTGEPIDWMETLSPKKWKLNGEIVNFDWS